MLSYRYSWRWVNQLWMAGPHICCNANNSVLTYGSNTNKAVTSFTHSLLMIEEERDIHRPNRMRSGCCVKV